MQKQKKRRSLSEEPTGKVVEGRFPHLDSVSYTRQSLPSQGDSSPLWGEDPLGHLSEGQKKEVSKNLKALVGQGEKELQSLFERLLGVQISTVFEVAQKASLGGEFGGLIPLSKEDSMPLIGMWMKKLKEFQKKGLYQGELPGAFALRMKEDGTLILKAIHVPKGMVFSTDSVESSVGKQHPHRSRIQDVSEWAEDEREGEEPKRRSLDDESGS